MQEVNGMSLLTFPGLCLVEHADVATHFELIAIKPDGAFVVLAILGVVNSTSLPFLLRLGEA